MLNNLHITPHRCGLQIEDGTTTQLITPLSAGIVRCVTKKGAPDPGAPSLLIDPEIAGSIGPFSLIEEEQSVLLCTEKVHVRVDRKNGNLTWERPDGSIYLQETGRELSEIEVLHHTSGKEGSKVRRQKTVDGERNFIDELQTVVDRKAYQARVFFDFQKEEAIHGLGQAEEGIYDYRGHNQYLYQHNMRIPMPVFTSTRGYGFLVDCGSLMTFCDEGPRSYLFLDTVEQLDTYFIAGPSMDEVVAGIRALTGRAQMLPRWAYGYIQSKEQYYTARELLSVVQEYRKRGIPLDCVVQDWNSWEEGQWGNKHVDPTRYGDLKERMRDIHDLKAHAIVSVWPNMNQGCADYEEFRQAGMLLEDQSTYDAFREDARALYWKQCREELFAGGFDGWWCDSTEPFSGPDWQGEIKKEPWERFLLVGGEHKKFLDPAQANLYAMMHAKGIYENQRKETDKKRVFNLTRSGYAGSQKYGAMLWSGDTSATWETLKNQITEGLNMALSGYPYWTLDIGGFFTVKDKYENRGCGCSGLKEERWFWKGDYNEGCQDLGYRELYTRWLQLGTFLPMFRSHGTDTPREIWNFGEPGTPFYDTIEKFIKLRYHLMPYIYSQAAAIHFEHASLLRPLIFDFREDPKACSVQDEFLFGPSLLICPVTKPMYYGPESEKLEGMEKTRECYLPAGTDWYDYWTDKWYPGGQNVIADAPLDKIPIFVKAGSILPTTEGLQSTEELNGAKVTIQIYPGASGDFRFYEDDGDGYDFEQGQYHWTNLHWNEEEQKLTQTEEGENFEGWVPPVFDYLIHQKRR